MLAAVTRAAARARAATSGGSRVRAGTRAAPAAEPSVTSCRGAAPGPFWLLSLAFFLASIAAIAMTVHAIPFLLERGHSAGVRRLRASA